MLHEVLEHIDVSSWHEVPSEEIRAKAIKALESGKVVYLPTLAFAVAEHEEQFLTPDICNTKHKNVSYDIARGKLGGTKPTAEQERALKQFMHRYAVHSKQLLSNIFPHYSAHARQARTSFRPVEISGRKAPSYRKDDTLLHIDAFPATPVQGQRILRVFSNVNPYGKPRVWRVGEPLSQVVNKFAGAINQPLPGSALLQQLFKITRGYRTKYDHYMLKLHHMMKADVDYQKNVTQHEVQFSPGSTWFVFTDQVSHAAMSGQHVFEQTFYLPVHALQNPHTSPLKVLERFLGENLV